MLHHSSLTVIESELVIELDGGILSLYSSSIGTFGKEVYRGLITILESTE